MSKKVYVGINNTASNVDKIYVGINNVARTVKKAYVGINGIAQQFYQKPLEYLESTGTQYINTGIVPKTNTRMVLKFASRDVTVECYNGWIMTTGSLFSCGHGSNSVDTYFQCIVSNSWSWTASTTSIDTNIHIWDISNSAKIFDGTNFGTGNCQNASSGQTLYLFAQHLNWSPYTNYAKERIYYCKIYEGDTLVRDFVPALDTNNVPCLYDKVTSTYFYNQGTGTFLYA